MNSKIRLTSLCLAFLMFLSVLQVYPKLAVNAEEAISVSANDSKDTEGIAITNAAEFAAMDPAGTYYLANDIAIDEPYHPVFMGVFDGNGKTVTISQPMFANFAGKIKNLTVEGKVISLAPESEISCLAEIGARGAVAAVVDYGTDIVFENIINNAAVSAIGNIPDSNNCAGGIVGLVNNEFISVSFINCINNAAITGLNQLGGIVGAVMASASVTFDSCVNNGVITETGINAYSGGIVGRDDADWTAFKNCTNNANISSGKDNAAGMIAYSSKGSFVFDACINNGNIMSTAGNAGGLISNINCNDATGTKYSYVTITNCVNYGDITGNGYTAGIAAFVQKNLDTVIANCVNYGTIKGGHDSGGIVGHFTQAVAKISYCENFGAVDTSGSGQYAGGICGYAWGTKAASWSVDKYSAIVEYCINHADIIGDTRTGGICASTGASDCVGTFLINYCINLGDVTSNGVKNSASQNCVAGILGYAYGTADTAYPIVSNCVNVGDVTMESPDIGNASYFLGYVNSPLAVVTNNIATGTLASACGNVTAIGWNNKQEFAAGNLVGNSIPAGCTYRFTYENGVIDKVYEVGTTNETALVSGEFVYNFNQEAGQEVLYMTLDGTFNPTLIAAEDGSNRVIKNDDGTYSNAGKYCEKHTWDDGVITKQPTCINEGVVTYTCPVCKAIKKEYIPVVAHTIKYVEAVAPTCETWGNVAYWFCENCGYAWLDKALTQVTALKYVSLEPAHSLVHVEAKDYSCQSEGNIEYWYCSACDWMQTAGGVATNRLAVILPAAHKLVRVEAKAAMCFEKGNIEYWYCSACDWVEVAGGVASNRRAVVLPEIGSHTIVHVEAKAPTAYANGNIEYWYCAVCGYAWLDEKCTLNTNLLSVILPATGAPASEGLAYELNSDGTAYIVTGIGTCKDQELVIPSSYNGLPVTGIADNAFNGNTSITSIYIPSTISAIGSQAFRNCKNLKATYIDDLVAWCNIKFSGTLASPISYSGKLYLNGELIVDLVIPKSVTVLQDYAFYGCTSIKSVVCHDNMTSLGLITFYGCVNLESVVLPTNLKRLEKSLFYNCKALKNITLPDTLQYIGTYAFQGSGIESITIPAKVTSIGNGAFAETDNLKSIKVDAKNKYYMVVDNCLILIKSKMLIAVCGDYTIPADGSVTAIGPYAFYSSNMSEVALPDTITTIGMDAFYNSELSSIIIPSSVVSIDSWAFGNCSNLKTVYMPASVQTIKASAFANCRNITAFIYEGTEEQWNAIAKDAKWNSNSTFTVIFAGESVASEGLAMKLNENGMGYTVIGIGTCKDTDIVIPAVYNRLPVTSIGMDAFSKTNITSIVIPNTVQLIDRAAFADCTSLNDVTFTGTKAQILAVSLVDGWDDNCPFAVIHCTDGDVSFGPDALEFTLNKSGTAYTVTGIGTCKDTDIVIPAVYNGLPVTAIADYAFEGNKSITSITIPDGLVSIGYGAFYNCTALKKVVFSKSVSTLGNFILYGCTALTELLVEEGNETFISVDNCIIDYNTKTLVLGCAGSKIPADGSITTIGSYAFVGSGLTSIVIPDSIATIEPYAFAECKMLESVHVGSGATYIDLTAFSNSYIKSFTIDENNNTYVAINNCLIKKKSKQLIAAFSGFVLPTDGSITSIASGAFYYLDVTSIVIPEGVTSIGSSAFSHCENLTSITFPSTLKTIYSCPLNYCDNLETVIFHKDNKTFTVVNNCIINKETKTLVAVFGEFKIPSDGSVTTIGDYAFQYKSDIKRIELPVGITTINKYAFRSCTKLETIVLPNTITNINDYAFNNCRNLKTIIFNGTEEQWNNVVKSNNWDKGMSFTIEIAGEPVHTHSFSAWIGNGEVHTRSCSCGAVETEAHSWGEGVITVYPTVTTVGCKTYACAICGDTKIEVIPAYSVPDFDADGKISYSDVQIVMQYITDSTVEIDVKAADINGDGEVNIRDAALVLQAMMYGILPD